MSGVQPRVSGVREMGDDDICQLWMQNEDLEEPIFPMDFASHYGAAM